MIVSVLRLVLWSRGSKRPANRQQPMVFFNLVLKMNDLMFFFSTSRQSIHTNSDKPSITISPQTLKGLQSYWHGNTHLSEVCSEVCSGAQEFKMNPTLVLISVPVSAVSTQKKTTTIQHFKAFSSSKGKVKCDLSTSEGAEIIRLMKKNWWVGFFCFGLVFLVSLLVWEQQLTQHFF